MTDTTLITVEEAAQRLHIGRSHLYKYIASGQLPSLLLGKSRRVVVSALETFIAELSRPEVDADCE